MSGGPLDAFLKRLEDELRQRGGLDLRLLDEAREHLIDAVEEGRRRGLSIDDAQREAIERFGPPETIAAQAVPGRHPMVNRVAAVFDRVWSRKWWILAPTAVTAILTSVLSFYFLPTRYRSEMLIHVLKPSLPLGVMPVEADRTAARVESISRTILSPARLEWIIRDFGLYGATSGRPSADQVHMMQRDISVNFVPAPRQTDTVLAGLNISFQSADPKLAMRITERLTSLFVEENMRDREMLMAVQSQRVDSEIFDVRQRLTEAEYALNLRRQRYGEPPRQAELIAFEVLRDRYRQLLVRREEIKSTESLERRALGEQFRIVEGARIPESPVGPSRLSVNVMGALAGLGFGVVLVAVRGRSAR